MEPVTSLKFVFLLLLVMAGKAQIFAKNNSRTTTQSRSKTDRATTPGATIQTTTAVPPTTTTTTTIATTATTMVPTVFSTPSTNFSGNATNHTMSVCKRLAGKVVEQIHKDSMATVFILAMLAMTVLLVHALIKFRVRVIPDSLVAIGLGIIVGVILLFVTGRHWDREESFSFDTFFLVLLPPIIFEGGYNLNKGNFFTNIGSVLTFSIIGTLLSAAIIGGFIYFFGAMGILYELSIVDSFAFGSLLSAIDPVATLALFRATQIDQVLYMLVFGESVLNDAVAIVLYSTIIELKSPCVAQLAVGPQLFEAFKHFLAKFLGSSLIGIAAGLCSALLLKHVDLRQTPSLEFAVMLIFAYLPYGLSQGLHLSGIMAILFCGIVMSHYTHYSLSPMTQITMQETWRTLAFIAEACVFAYLGMAFFTLTLSWEPAFIFISIALCLIARAVNIFPLSWIVNRCRTYKISCKQQFIMWFSGMRGAIAFALSLHMPFDEPKTRAVVITSTLAIVLITTVVFGGSTLPLMKFLKLFETRPVDIPRKPSAALAISKSEGFDNVRVDVGSVDGGDTDSVSPKQSIRKRGSVVSPHPLVARKLRESKVSFAAPPREELGGIALFDKLYLRPIFVRRFTKQERYEGAAKLMALAQSWMLETRLYQTATSSSFDVSLAAEAVEEDEEASTTDLFSKPSMTVTEAGASVDEDESSGLLGSRSQKPFYSAIISED